MHAGAVGWKRRASSVDVDDLLRALDDAQAELQRLKADREDLMASAELWADLYTATVDRANAAEAVVRRLAEVPGDVQRYYSLLDAIMVLREAVECRCSNARTARVLRRRNPGPGPGGVVRTLREGGRRAARDARVALLMHWPCRTVWKIGFRSRSGVGPRPA